MSRATLDLRVGGTRIEAAPTVRPVMLLTLNVPFDPAAVEFAIDTAAETGCELYVCDAIPLEYRSYVGHAARQFAEQTNRRELNEVAARARGRGVRVSQLAFHNPKPIQASLEVASRESVGLLVFGPDRAGLGRFAFRRAARKLRQNAGCLVWTNE
jgi:nucleotide-binding universal stress UspA family protein